MSFDNIDRKIIELLKEDSKMSLKAIGELTHLTGQAVGIRINKLIDEGIIENYTINVNEEKLHSGMTVFMNIYMEKLLHDNIQRIFRDSPEVIEAFKTTGEACYMIKVIVKNNDHLEKIIEKIIPYANYSIVNVMRRVK
jgi:Lrp/AsnC family leucine-responsive transcriptional regulator